MERLPDVVVVEVMKRLPLDDLMRCRLVCRRWRILAMHPSAWCHRCITDGYLRASPPCCRRLRVWALQAHGFPAATTECRIAVLEFMRIGGVDDLDLSMAALVIRHHVSLGRLKSLIFRFPDKKITGLNGLFDLCSVLQRLEGVEELEIRGLHFSEDVVKKLTRHPHWGIAGPPCLQKLTVSGRVRLSKASLLLEPLLRTHAPTLQELHIYDVDPWTCNLFDWLRESTQLREVTCPVVDGIERLLQCPNLSILNLTVYGADVRKAGIEDTEGHRRTGVRALFGAKSLLRAATRLRKVGLNYRTDFGIPWENLVDGLAQSAATELTSLSVCVDENKNVTLDEMIWYDLLRPIPKLLRLETLFFGGSVSSNLLKEFRSPPSLTSLTVEEVYACLCCCYSDVIEFLRFNPGVMFTIGKNSYFCSRHSSCRKDCISSLLLSGVTYEMALSTSKNVVQRVT